MIHKIIIITPVPKPRMTRRDKWEKRTCVLRYRAFCDELRLKVGPLPEDPWAFRLQFYMPMPKSWPEKEKAIMDTMHHRQRPDIDNLTKAVMDALLAEDSKICDIQATKYWARTGAIALTIK